jgi:glucose-6-phosphate isomerase
MVVCSKLFTTLETVTTARLARGWISRRLGEAAVPGHFAAVSVNNSVTNECGIAQDAGFTIWGWVGGRDSKWSPIGFGIELAIGSTHFEAFLGGEFAIDEHFKLARVARNLPMILGLVALRNRNPIGFACHAILPYDQRLRRFPAYLRQLSMESNGKRIRRGGNTVCWDTERVLWGVPGSNGQQSFFQLLHHGTAKVSRRFLLPARSSVDLLDSQSLVAANCLARAEALASGYTLDEAVRELEAKQLNPEQVPEPALRQVYAGNRSNRILAFEHLDPKTRGTQVALYEHKVFVSSVTSDIDAFDQWGVELGKQLAGSLAPAVRGAERLDAQPRLQALIGRLSEWRRS